MLNGIVDFNYKDDHNMIIKTYEPYINMLKELKKLQNNDMIIIDNILNQIHELINSSKVSGTFKKVRSKYSYVVNIHNNIMKQISSLALQMLR